MLTHEDPVEEGKSIMLINSDVEKTMHIGIYPLVLVFFTLFQFGLCFFLFEVSLWFAFIFI